MRLRLLFNLIFDLLGLGLWRITLTWLFSRNQRIGFGPKWQLPKHQTTNQRTYPETLVLCQLFEFFKKTWDLDSAVVLFSIFYEPS
jgi:hypothetical protein